MPEQQALFVESHEDAARALVLAIGGFKRVGTMLRPELSADVAGRWLADCLNPDRRDHLTPEQLALLRRAGHDEGCHVLAFYEAREAGYAEPTPIEPDDEKAELERRAIAAVGDLKQIVARLENVSKRRR